MSPWKIKVAWKGNVILLHDSDVNNIYMAMVMLTLITHFNKNWYILERKSRQSECIVGEEYGS